MRKITEVIEVDQLEDKNNERLSVAMPHSGLKIENKKIKIMEVIEVDQLEDKNNERLS